MREEIWTEKIFKDDAGYFWRISIDNKPLKCVARLHIWEAFHLADGLSLAYHSFFMTDYQQSSASGQPRTHSRIVQAQSLKFPSSAGACRRHDKVPHKHPVQPQHQLRGDSPRKPRFHSRNAMFTSPLSLASIQRAAHSPPPALSPPTNIWSLRMPSSSALVTINFSAA